MSASRHRRGPTVFFLIVGALSLGGCGGGDGGGGGQPQTYTVGVTVKGLQSSSVVLQLNGQHNLTVSANGVATFSNSLSTGTGYTVTVSTQPAGQTCSVTSATGTVGSANVTTPTVTCTLTGPFQYTVTVNVSGFVGSSTLVLQLNGAAQLAITGNGAWTFSTKLATAEHYAIAVLSQPTLPSNLICSLANASGTVGNGNINNVQATCTLIYTVEAVIGGYAGQGLVLQLNGGNDLPVTASGGAITDAVFANGLSAGSQYVVTIKSQPTTPAQVCSLGDGTGKVGTANVDVHLLCPLIYSATTKGDWTWMNLDVDPSSQDVANTGPGIASILNNPSVRAGANTWVDASGHLWLFGGTGYNYMGLSGITYNDLWEYDASAGTWSWSQATASFGTKGQPSPSNWPTTSGIVSWQKNGTVWIFGTLDYSNDLWSYDIATGIWTWVSGSNIAGAAGVYGSQGTPTAANVPGARYGAVSWTDLSGNLWLMGGYVGTNSAATWGNDLWEYSPATGLWVWVAGSVAGTQGAGPKGVYGTKGVPATTNVPGGRNGAVSWTDSAGNLWLFGGAGVDSAGNTGNLNDLWKYTPAATFGALGTWTWVGGSETAGGLATYGTQGVPSVNNIPGARTPAASWVDRSGNFWLFGGYGCTTSCIQLGVGPLDDLWRYSPVSGAWTWMKGSNTPYGGAVGKPGVSAAGNTPGPRVGSGSTWVDPAGNLWLFGGVELGSPPQYQNDLWVYAPQ